MANPRKSARSWRGRQEEDPYVQMARRDGWRSRAVYKLDQIVAKEPLLHPGMTCIDLGAAPGSWSQYVSERLDGRASVIAVDVLPMDPLPCVEFIQGDFTDDEVLESIMAVLGGSRVDLVLSDMAPNITGNKVVDQPRVMYLAELALGLARQTLRAGGSFVCKLFQGQGFEQFVADARASFKKVKIVKPKASRPASSEVYLVARNYQL